MSASTSNRRQMVKAAMSAPYLTREEEQELAIRWRTNGDRKALERLSLSHMRLVIAVASRFRNFGLPMSDMIQEGHIGLLEAASRFEPEREVRFSTYATWWIRASIQDFILRNWSIVRGGTSSTQKALFFNLRRLRAKLSGEQQGITESELHRKIAETIGVKTADVDMMAARLSGPDTSLNAPLTESEGSSAERQDFLVSDAPLPDDIVVDAIDGERQTRWLSSAMAVLTERERRVLQERRLKDDSATLESIGQTMGISKERVRQIENRALEKLRDALLKIHPDRLAFLR
ncbi:RNA polymerase factor sigma-32 [Microvirga tunisiensis]|uniref:RNA polymerase factor sigma-32 n=2 Tax=Pannonibacter tanglangensis TaxID=2750084 RepID=A0ABW9ZSQ7_9HYPH|nr:MULTISPECIES: RNA polymerase factor sigma-32 [unclassified Pannonibacter]NBN65954.1 RNA polymerase factor sigma-32 [Pannonibacter sp. XCT-34]NBN80450.1 RNA polymerase factor sigma-32 [Pannonibacter sp. XCT-53]